MADVEQQLLTKAKASDFTAYRLLGVGKHGMVVQAKFNNRNLPDQEKLYAIKLLFNFTHEYSSVTSNKFENEWLISSRILPHPNIVRYWSQFISPISDSFLPHIPSETRQLVIKKGSGEETINRMGQFLVFDCHSVTLCDWLAKNRGSSLCNPTTLLRFCCELLEAVNYLQKHCICHLDLKLENVLVSDSLKMKLCDFGSAIQFSDANFNLQFIHGMSIGGNRAHLSPEVLTQYHACRTNPQNKTINYRKQAAFAIGVLQYEIIMGNHPLEDYPLSCMQEGIVSYPSSAVPPLSSFYPHQLSQIVSGLLSSDESERLDLFSAMESVKQIASGGLQIDSGYLNLEEELQKLRAEKDLAKSHIKILASERDQALKEMKRMAEQCQEVALEFEKLAIECDRANEQLRESLKEKTAVVTASEKAFQAYEIVKKQLELVVRERDIAKRQVEELRAFCSKFETEKDLKECVRCKSFFVDVDNSESACCWHKGKYLFDRWSCCYKNEENAEGCMRTPHMPL